MTATLLLTRPAAASARFLAEVEGALGRSVPAIISPLIEIAPIACHWDGTAVAGLILTSENGAMAAGAMGFPPGLTAYAVGDRTAQAARAAGFTPVTADGDAGRLIALILSKGDKGPLLHLRGEHARGDIAARLTDAGVTCSEKVVYRQHETRLTPEAEKLLRGTKPVVLPLFSPRTGTIFANQWVFSAPLHVVTLSKAIAAAVKPLPVATLICAKRADRDAMLAPTLSALRALGIGPAA